MRLSVAWLNDWFGAAATDDSAVAISDYNALASQLTMAGLEVDSIELQEAVKGPYTTARILAVESHPNADKLRLVTLSFSASSDAASSDDQLTLVCGAPNVAPEQIVVVAQTGAVTAQGVEIKPVSIRGVESTGMLVSEEELGLAEKSAGILVLPQETPVGLDFIEYACLQDILIEVDLTPNRGDCLSQLGLAREVAALCSQNSTDDKTPKKETDQIPDLVSALDVPDISPGHGQTLQVAVQVPEACPVYRCCLLTNIDSKAATPFWMAERLRRAGLGRSTLLVDVTNYVMLELGQPLHAFDAEKLKGSLQVRLAKPSESLQLLGDKVIELSSDSLVIADQAGPVALAGVMGGEASSVTESTTSILLESAFFAPVAISGRARHYGLHTDASHRFERGVDPELSKLALARAVELLVKFAGAVAGPEVAVISEQNRPAVAVISLRLNELNALLELALTEDIVCQQLRALGATVVLDNTDPSDVSFQVTPPTHRFDWSIEQDLIEEVARMVGYDNLPSKMPLLAAKPLPISEEVIALESVKLSLVKLGYQEAVTYSFVSQKYQDLCDPECSAIALQNPISSELGVMRTSLWPGLLRAAEYNLNRQHSTVKIFECGKVFRPVAGKNVELSSSARSCDVTESIDQVDKVAALWVGSRLAECWDGPAVPVDFFDMKGALETLLRPQFKGESPQFVAATHPALHPGQSASITFADGGQGWVGRLHPAIEQVLGFDSEVFLFELPLKNISMSVVPRFQALSRFPSVRRDIAIVVAESITVGDVCHLIKKTAGDLLKEVRVFDVFQGGSLQQGEKSLAIAIILESFDGTLQDKQTKAAIESIVMVLQQELDAQLRS